MSAMNTEPTSEKLAGAVLTIDLGAIRANYRHLKQQLGGLPCAAAIKADAYGTGAAQVAPVLAAEGCTSFFVAHVAEGIELRNLLPGAEIHILNGLLPDSEAAYRQHRLVPVLGSLPEIDSWLAFCGDDPLPCDLHVDTGMARLGLPSAEVVALAADTDRLAKLDVAYVMSHLASAEEETPQNTQQLVRFHEIRRQLPMGQASLCNSSGIFLGADYHFDLARPGVALYGVNPTPKRSNPMRQVVSLKARVLQVRDAVSGDTVGYNATHTITLPTKVATVPVGYADGYSRALSNRGRAVINGVLAPVIGRVSMDLITLDVSAVPDADHLRGAWAELIGDQSGITLQDIAAAIGSNEYEVLTSLGRRYYRCYIDAAN
jgi:alanine racemase